MDKSFQPTNFHSPETARNSTDSWNTSLLNWSLKLELSLSPILTSSRPSPPLSLPKNHAGLHRARVPSYGLRKNPRQKERKRKILRVNTRERHEFSFTSFTIIFLSLNSTRSFEASRSRFCRRVADY